jgi:hypothetical protein
MASELLNCVLKWTAGHPLLTLKFCSDIRDREIHVPEDFDRHVKSCIRGIWGPNADPKLRIDVQETEQYVLKRMKKRSDFLKIYDALLKGQKIRGDPEDVARFDLKASGIVSVSLSGTLMPRNRFYRRIFDRRWIGKITAERQDTAPGT